MTTQESLNYDRIAAAIEYIRANFRDQPNLDDVAEKVHLSPFHFQRLFTEWAGTTPKKFLQYISIEHAKKILNENNTLFAAAHATGLSGTGRLHDLFVNIEGMTPAEYRDGGKDLEINYSVAESPFGNLIVASTSKGICYMAFEETENVALANLTQKFPNARFTQKLDLLQQNALFIFQNDWSKLGTIKLHLKGTEFQLKVWASLLRIPLGQLATYNSIARHIDKPGASRAVGTAIGSNPVAYLIPCHRVIQSTGLFGDYMWGATRKAAIIGWEGTKVNP
jgi:AraC family transcriptional regulator of adaptative response/methylated-DNA-[protein]-cysteine methyltransferase